MIQLGCTGDSNGMSGIATTAGDKILGKFQIKQYLFFLQ